MRLRAWALVLFAGVGMSLVVVAAAPALDRTERVDPANQDSAAGSWRAVTSMGSARIRHTATLLPNRRVLVVGGEGEGGLFPGPELYDPDTDTWSPAGSPGSAVQRAGHTATLLSDGRVLIVGGYGPDGGFSEGNWGSLSSALLFDPRTNSWSSAGSTASATYANTATLLASGKVLVAGGYGYPDLVATADLYDPATNSWSSAGSMSIGRYGHSATPLADGRVLVAGGIAAAPGEAGDVAASAEIYDPVANNWAPAASMNTARYYQMSTLLPTGDILVAGGSNYVSGDLAGSERYDPETNRWEPAASMRVGRAYRVGVPLKHGDFMAVGGFAPQTSVPTEIYHARRDLWTQAAPMSDVRYYHTATRLHDGSILVAGGYVGNVISSSVERLSRRK